MKLSSKLFVMSMLLLLCWLRLRCPTRTRSRTLNPLLANAHGKGTLTVGDGVYKVTNVVVKLDEDGTGEITLVTNLQLFVQCTWSAPADLSQGIDLKITGWNKRWQRRRDRETSAATGWKEIAGLSMGASGNARKRGKSALRLSPN